MASYAPFQDYNVGNVSLYVPEKAGVYLIRLHLINGKTRYVYVGQAKDLRSRLLDHLRGNEPNACLKEHVSKHRLSYTWVELPRQEDRDREEKSKYDEYNPECNRISPPA